MGVGQEGGEGQLPGGERAPGIHPPPVATRPLQEGKFFADEFVGPNLSACTPEACNDAAVRHGRFGGARVQGALGALLCALVPVHMCGGEGASATCARGLHVWGVRPHLGTWAPGLGSKPMHHPRALVAACMVGRWIPPAVHP